MNEPCVTNEDYSHQCNCNNIGIKNLFNFHFLSLLMYPLNRYKSLQGWNALEMSYSTSPGQEEIQVIIYVYKYLQHLYSGVGASEAQWWRAGLLVNRSSD